ncbi:protein kinase family protein [Mycobacterium florentinum]|uniref:protein kinase family protein n=1 Tax=Mycobacterium florentinum TaxID=292462 RepID=UPI0013D83E4A|nr:protein kinase family protein [Mycobacterium florentinum]MCV7409231.1 protein kinase family protein [Mycobacterium florentinum]
MLTKIGQGGQGVVYRAPNVKTKFATSMVYKEYKTQTQAEIDFTALAAMPALVEDSLTYAQAERLVSIAAWPCALVEDSGKTTGFVMPAISDQFFIPMTTAKGTSTTTAEFQHLLNHSTVLEARGINISVAQRYTLLREVASTLTFLHEHGVCVGDISPKNLLFSLEPREAIYFIDCDAMRINGTSALRQVETPGWGVPSGEELATIYSDTYKLGLLALRLLAGDQNTQNPQHLPTSTPSLLRQIITDTLKPQAEARPLPQAWTYVLGHAVEEAQHQTLTAAAASTSIALEPPPTPVVHSRPPAGGKRAQPVASPAYSQPPFSQPPPMSAPPSQRSTTNAWPFVALAGVIAVVIIAAVVLVNALKSSPSNSNSSFNAQTTTSSYSDTYSSYASSPTPTTTATRTFSMPSDLLSGPDFNGDPNCVNGEPLPNHPGGRVGPKSYGANGGKTSCAFAFSVGRAYWDTNPTPGPDPQRVVAAGTVACTFVQQSHPNVQCSGNNFVMYCSIESGDNWITCRGGNDAVVYIF